MANVLRVSSIFLFSFPVTYFLSLVSLSLFLFRGASVTSSTARVQATGSRWCGTTERRRLDWKQKKRECWPTATECSMQRKRQARARRRRRGLTQKTRRLACASPLGALLEFQFRFSPRRPPRSTATPTVGLHFLRSVTRPSRFVLLSAPSLSHSLAALRVS